MTDRKRCYTACERYALAVIYALRNFKVYLLSIIPFTLKIDHDALRYAFPKNDIHGHLAKWIDFLVE